MSMRWRLSVVLALSLAGRVSAVAQGLNVSADLCHAAGTAAERTHNIPSGMLVAIGRVESGRRHPVTGATVPWPWTINAAGTGRMFDNAAQAIEATRALRAGGLTSIDVGCFQVNLMHHASAFPSLDVAFDPQANADYAAQFLTVLRERTGSWEEAIAAYHSSIPALGGPYRDKVLGRWTGGGGAPAMSRPVVTVWATPVAAFGIRVWTPSSDGAVPYSVSLGGAGSVVRMAARPPPTTERGADPQVVDLPLPTVRSGLPPGLARPSLTRPACGTSPNRCVAMR